MFIVYCLLFGLLGLWLRFQGFVLLGLWLRVHRLLAVRWLLAVAVRLLLGVARVPGLGFRV